MWCSVFERRRFSGVREVSGGVGASLSGSRKDVLGGDDLLSLRYLESKSQRNGSK